MSADDSAQRQEAPARRRRGRPRAGSTPTGRTRRKRIGGADLTQKLNEMVAELIKENRKLRRQVVKLTEQGSRATSGAVERSLRTIQRRVQRALTPAPAKRRKRKTAAAATPRRKTVTRRRRKAS